MKVGQATIKIAERKLKFLKSRPDATLEEIAAYMDGHADSKEVDAVMAYAKGSKIDIATPLGRRSVGGYSDSTRLRATAGSRLVVIAKLFGDSLERRDTGAVEFDVKQWVTVPQMGPWLDQ